MFTAALAAAGKVFGWLARKADAKVQITAIQGEVVKEYIEADVRLAAIRKDLMKMQFGWGPTRWIVPCIAYPTIVWYGAVILDSLNVLNFLGVPEEAWKVDALPSPLDQWAGSIILSFFLISGGQSVMSIFMNSSRGLLDKVADKLFNFKPTAK